MDVFYETKQILEKYKIRANKELGQNFLIDDNVVQKIIESANINRNDFVIEIGPGLGVLTNRLLDRSNNVIAIELDKKMVNVITDRFKERENLEIINEDILKVDLKALIQEKKQKNNIEQVKIVANLPYYISTPIIMKLLEKKLGINEIIVMVQKEVADRLTSKTGERLAGAITYAIEYYSEAEEIIKVPKESFIPSPKVESEVIKLKIRETPKVNVKNETLLFNLIQKSFSQRRKTLVNALVNYNFVKDKTIAEKMLQELEIDTNVRGEKLQLEDFAKIANFLSR